MSFQTAWVNHSTLKPTMQSIGVPPDTTGNNFEYHLPTVRLPCGTVVTESSVIASKLEEIQPSPSLHLDPELQAAADHAVHMVAIPLFANYIPAVARKIIKESTVPDFENSRKERFGMSLQELEEKKGGPQAWTAAEPGFNDLGSLMSSHKVDEGPFIRGSEVCYADFVLAAMFESIKRVDTVMFDTAIGKNPAFQKLYDACHDWLQNDQ